MYKNYSNRLTSMGAKMNAKVTEINNVINEMEKKSKSIGTEEFDAYIQKIRRLQGELMTMKDALVKRNEELETTVKVQNEKIRSLETSVASLKKEVETLKVQQKEQGNSLQTQIHELKARMSHSTLAIEFGITSLVEEARRLEGTKGNVTPE